MEGGENVSWWISLHNPNHEGKPTYEDADLFQEGGTYVLGGSNEMSLNVTYNYGVHFNFQAIDQMTAQCTIKLFENVIRDLDDHVDPDYWKPTGGNVKKAIILLLSWAKQHPEGIWEVH